MLQRRLGGATVLDRRYLTIPVLNIAMMWWTKAESQLYTDKELLLLFVHGCFEI